MLLKTLLTFVVSLIATHAAATPCDCSRTEGSCQATSSYQNGSLLIRSNTTQCSFVVYTINGNPTISTVIDGEADSGWIGAGIPNVTIRSCDVCKDNRGLTSQSGSPSAQDNPPWATGEWRNGSEIITLTPDGRWTRWSVGLDRQVHQGTFEVNGNDLLLTADSNNVTQTYTYTIGTGLEAGIPILEGRRNRIVRPDVWAHWTRPRKGP